MTDQSSIIIREMQIGEEQKVRTLFRRNLWLVDRIVFTACFNNLSKEINAQKDATCLIAEENGMILGTMSLHVKEIKSIKNGFIDAVAIDKNTRGKGIGKRLLDASIEWLTKKECNYIFATADRYNSRSFNMFLHNGFEIYEFGSQFHDFGLKFFNLWVAESYLFGFNTYFLKKDGKSIPFKSSVSSPSISSKQSQPALTKVMVKESRSYIHFMMAWFQMTIVFMIISLLGGDSIVFLPYIFVIIGPILALHEIGHFIIARFFHLKMYFRYWDNGLWFTFVLALIRGIFPVYGSSYMKQLDWDYERNRKTSGIIYLTGPIIHMLLIILCWVLITYFSASFSLIWTKTINLAKLINIYLAIFNLLPIRGAGGFSWDGGKIYHWNKVIWGLLVIGIILIIIFF